METTTYSVPECNLAELEGRVEKLNRRCRRLGVPEITLAKRLDHTRHEVRQLTVNGEMNRCWRATIEKVEATGTAYLANAFEPTGRVMAWWSVDVTGESPSLNGWTFAAVLEPMTTEDGQTLNLIQTVPGQTCPAEYRNRVGQCDHCKATRRRSQTFVLRHEDGRTVCVGRMCLKDFLGYHADPAALASQAELMAELGQLCGMAEDEEGFGYGGGYRADAWDLAHFLTLTACRVRLFGWLGRGKAYEQGDRRAATADNVLEMLTPPDRMAGEKARQEWDAFCDKHTVEDQDRQQAEAAIEWAKAIPESERSGDEQSYLANVNLVARVGSASRKTAGIAASIIIGYLKAQEREFKRQERAARPESHHVGVVGERIQVIEVTCEQVIMSEGQYGVTGIHKMHDAAGNDLTWFATGGRKLADGETATVSLTVKDHGEYQGRKQTVVSRVSVWTPEALAEYQAKEAKKAARAAKKSARLTHAN